MNAHTFATCAYKGSPYLRSYVKSLEKQTVPGTIILYISTPNPYIQGMTDKYEVPMSARDGQSGIQADWNFAYHVADSGLVTIAHQDDMYHRQYAATVQNCWKRYPDTSMTTMDAVVVEHGQLQKPDQVESVKKVLRPPLRIPALNHLTAVKRSVLRFGNPVMCPSCTYNREMLGEPLFQSDHEFALDQDTMTQLAERDGRLIYIEKPLLHYHTHEEVTTKSCIKDHRREREETDMYRKFWPDFLVKLLVKGYRRAYDSYDEV